MIKSAESEAFLLITVLKCVEHNVCMSDYLFAKDDVLFCQIWNFLLSNNFFTLISEIKKSGKN